MSKRLIVAASLMALTGVVHVTMGAVAVYTPLLAVAPSPELTLYLALLWHFVTAFFVLGAAGLFWAAADPAHRRQTIFSIVALALAMGGLFFVYGLLVLGEVWTAPQWCITLIIAALALWPAHKTA